MLLLQCLTRRQLLRKAQILCYTAKCWGCHFTEIKIIILWTVQLRAACVLCLRSSTEFKWCHGLQVNPLQQGKFHLWEKKKKYILYCLDLGLYFLVYNVKSWSWWHCSWLFWFRVFVLSLWKTLCYSAVEVSWCACPVHEELQISGSKQCASLRMSSLLLVRSECQTSGHKHVFCIWWVAFLQLVAPWHKPVFWFKAPYASKYSPQFFRLIQTHSECPGN